MNGITRRRFVLFATRVITTTFLGVQAIGCSGISTLERRIRALIAEGNKITLTWNCGGDEAIVTSLVNNMKLEDRLMDELEIHVMNLLNLPDVGEFSMEGAAILVEENEVVYIEFESDFLGHSDLDELFSGKKKLF